MAILGAVAEPAEARQLQLAGRAGYLSEWRIEARVSDDPGTDAASSSGPVTLIHTGACTPNGPVEKAGSMTLRVSGWGPFATVEVDMRFPAASCVYRGRYGSRMSGAMDCSDAKGIPVELSVE